MYIVNGAQVFGDTFVAGQMIISPLSLTPSATVQVTASNNHFTVQNSSVVFHVEETEANINGGDFHLGAGSGIKIDDLQGIGDRPIGVDAGGRIIEISGGGGGGSFDITDDFSQTNTVASGDTLSITGRPGNNVLKTYFSSPSSLEVRLEGGSAGKVIGYDSDFGAGWVSVPQAYSINDNLTSGVPYVHTHGLGVDNLIVQVYDSTGLLVNNTSTIVVNTNDVTVTVTTTGTYHISIIHF